MTAKKKTTRLIPPDARLLTLRQASRYLGKGEWALRRMVWASEIAHVRDKKGSRLLFDRVDLDRWIEAHKTEPRKG